MSNTYFGLLFGCLWVAFAANMMRLVADRLSWGANAWALGAILFTAACMVLYGMHLDAKEGRWR